ncbi:serine/threonine protein kinase [Vogesella sp. LIG4]|uniref:serine/threonine protein kinase n=1 Tax=Vogesella sp. LIG4 TaxID=1192162 RepID=UPI00081FA2F2|nr:serine/threonine protein kinase [Vogesella sp. LIG4]SCK07074.1 Ser/Thr protein kinase RdoA involved in Cpx stress response, MazF antagonist [Vogesella sp. LIG4]
MTSIHPYAALTPDLILDAVESLGLRCDGHLLALNSYENRVYQIGMDDGAPLVAKFYRPQRWSDAQILEEHRFAAELLAEEIPVVAPLAFDGDTLLHWNGFRFALFPRRGGRAPELEDPQVLQWLGRFLGRIHLVGAAHDFAVRPTLDSYSFGHQSLTRILACPLLPAYLAPRYQAAAQQALQQVDAAFAALPDIRWLRSHGDCHTGNVMWTPDGPHFVDLDDSRMAPAVQDLWMLLSGDRQQQAGQLAELLAGYEDFAEFDYRELRLIEPLRTLRLMHYSAWLAARWDDPAFPAAFPWFGSEQYWLERIVELEGQCAAMREPPLFALPC